MIVRKQLGNTRDEVHCSGRNTPGKHGAKTGAHAEADHESVSRPALHRCHRKMHDVFCYRRKGRHAGAVHEQRTIRPGSCRNHSRSVVSPHFTLREHRFIVFAEAE